MALALRGLPCPTGVPPEYVEFTICREMGWTFTEMEAQPAWRVEQTLAFLQEEARAREAERRGHVRGS